MITAEQRLARRNHIGSSDIAALAGCDPWKSKLAVFMEKVYDVEDLPNKGPIARGNRYERALLDFAQEELGVELQRDVHVQHPEVTMGERESLGSIARKQTVLQDELARLREEQSVHVRQLEELDTLKCRAVEEAEAGGVLAERGRIKRELKAWVAKEVALRGWLTSSRFEEALDCICPEPT